MERRRVFPREDDQSRVEREHSRKGRWRSLLGL